VIRWTHAATRQFNIIQHGSSQSRRYFGMTINLPIRPQSKQSKADLLANLLLVKMGAFHRMLNTESWVRRLDDAEHALDGEWARTLGETVPLEPLNPVPTHVELMLWRPEAEAAFNLAAKLNRGLTAHPKWVRTYPHIVAYSYEIRQRAHEVLIKLDQLLLEQDLMAAYRKAPAETEGLVRRPSTALGVRQRKGKARKYHNDPSGSVPESTTIQ
jgi:hypothetical protein